MRRWLRVANEHAVNVDVEVTSRAVRHTGVLIDPIVLMGFLMRWHSPGHTLRSHFPAENGIAATAASDIVCQARSHALISPSGIGVAQTIFSTSCR